MRIGAWALPLLLLACREPVTVTRVVDDRPRILRQGAPAGAVLFLDGQASGAADAYAGRPGVLRVAPGTHRVEVRAGGRLLFSQMVFLGAGEQRTLAVGPEVKP